MMMLVEVVIVLMMMMLLGRGCYLNVAPVVAAPAARCCCF